MLTAAELKLSGIEARLYELIWKRTVATQMSNAQVSLTTALIEVTDTKTDAIATFRASGREVIFPLPEPTWKGRTIRQRRWTIKTSHCRR